MPFPGIEKLITDLSAFDFSEALRNVVINNQLVLRRYIQEQLAAGRSGDEQSTIFDSKEYRQTTIEIKESEGVGLGAVTDRVTNYMTGDFYASIKIDVEGNIFEADSDVPYFGDIRLYSKDSLLEVSTENRLEFANLYTLPEVAAELRERTGLIMTINAAA